MYSFIQVTPAMNRRNKAPRPDKLLNKKKFIFTNKRRKNQSVITPTQSRGVFSFSREKGKLLRTGINARLRTFKLISLRWSPALRATSKHLSRRLGTGRFAETSGSFAEFSDGTRTPRRRCRRG